MAEKFQNKYRTRSARCPNWDYSSNAAYFITICTQNRENYFGEIISQKMQLSQMGVIADILWHEIKNHAKNVDLDAFVVMPNHIHGILILNGENNNIKKTNNYSVETLHATSLRNNTTSLENATSPDNNTTSLNDTTPLPNENMSKISPKPGSVSTIIRSYKSAVTKHANRLGYTFAWKSRFHDHIIRNHRSFQQIREYIINNPVQWNKDKLFNN